MMRYSGRFCCALAVALVALLFPIGTQAQSAGADHAAAAALARGAGLTSPAEPAESLTDTTEDGPTEGCGDIDPSEPCYVNGGGTGEPVVMTCNAIGGLEMCWACHPNRFGKVVCARANYSAQCKCENRPVEGAGPGITYCVAAGKCTYI
jgi:hypothetical protein